MIIFKMFLLKLYKLFKKLVFYLKIYLLNFHIFLNQNFLYFFLYIRFEFISYKS